ncbi:MAG: tRNA dihydrouridine synthase DusB [Bacteroidota bacterium]
MGFGTFAKILVKIGKIKLGSMPVLLAPMEDATDMPFRLLCREMGASMVYSEFIAAEGLVRDIERSCRKLIFKEEERPIGIQIFSHDIENVKQAAVVAEAANPDLIDLNFGCPVKKVVARGGGAALLKDVPKMVQMAAEVVKQSKIPVTAKTRLGWDDKTKNIVEVAERLQDVGICALTIHGRTRMQLYKGEADWTLIGEVKNNPRMQIPIIGNGDICSGADAKRRFDETGVDAVMIGRAAIGNSWLFREVRNYLDKNIDTPPPSFFERIELCKRHFNMVMDYKGERTAVSEMRKHYKHYFKGIPSFKPLRIDLLTAKTAEEVQVIFEIISEMAGKE